MNDLDIWVSAHGGIRFILVSDMWVICPEMGTSTYGFGNVIICNDGAIRAVGKQLYS